MKCLVSMILIGVIAASGFAQDEMLFSGEVESGGFGGPVFKASQLNGESAILLGGHGGWLMNHKLLIGGGGYGLINEIGIEGLDDTSLSFGYGGAYAEYIISSSKLLHLSIGSMFGIGGVGYTRNSSDDEDAIIDDDGESFLVIEPSINVNLNVNKHFRLSVGASYRHINEVSYQDRNASDLNGYSLQIFAKMGLF